MEEDRDAEEENGEKAQVGKLSGTCESCACESCTCRVHVAQEGGKEV